MRRDQRLAIGRKCAVRVGRLGMDIAPSNPDVMYISVETEKEEEKGLYKSTDGANTFELVSTEFNTKVRPFYFSRVKVAPSDEDPSPHLVSALSDLLLGSFCRIAGLARRRDAFRAAGCRN